MTSKANNFTNIISCTNIVQLMINHKLSVKLYNTVFESRQFFNKGLVVYLWFCVSFYSLLFTLKMEHEHFEKVILWCFESKVLHLTVDLTKKTSTCCKIHLQFVPVIPLVMVSLFPNCANGLSFRLRSSPWMDGGQGVGINLQLYSKFSIFRRTSITVT